MKFRYRAYSDSVETGAKWTFYRPVVAILLRRSHATVRKVGLVDTGADLTLLPMSVSEALGVQLDSRHAIQVAGVGDSTVAAIPGELEFELRRK